MGDFVDIQHVADVHTLRDLLSRAERGSAALWHFDGGLAVHVKDDEPHEDRAHRWWTRASTAPDGSFLVVLFVREGPPEQWVMLAPPKVSAPSVKPNTNTDRVARNPLVDFAGAAYEAGVRLGLTWKKDA